jgi:hypothetical protein
MNYHKTCQGVVIATVKNNEMIFKCVECKKIIPRKEVDFRYTKCV